MVGSVAWKLHKTSRCAGWETEKIQNMREYCLGFFEEFLRSFNKTWRFLGFDFNNEASITTGKRRINKVNNDFNRKLRVFYRFLYIFTNILISWKANIFLSWFLRILSYLDLVLSILKQKNEHCLVI